MNVNGGIVVQLLGVIVGLHAVGCMSYRDGDRALPLEGHGASGAAVTATVDPRYMDKVKPVLDRRCVVCHSCFNAPCQLVLSSYEGADRGAIKEPVYHGDRREPMDPTRLFVDAKDTRGWRARGFFNVLGGATDGSDVASVMSGMLELGRNAPLTPGVPVPDDVPLDVNRKLECPSDSEFPDYAAGNPHGGMPYATAGLTDAEYETLSGWLQAGAGGPGPEAALSAAVRAEVRRWEAFLNGASQKQRLASRYIYEHLFLAHLHFPDHAPAKFFRMVRSTTPPGEPIDEIATARPYDPPGSGPMFYRLRPIDSTIVYKTHMVYPLGKAKLARLNALFLESDWAVKALPSYETKSSANPFVTFEQIPARARYQFLLDNAHYFIMTFIRGPVCRGQIALDVIDDHFFAAFLDPDADLSVTDPGFLDRSKQWLKLPASHESRFVPGGLRLEYSLARGKYMGFRDDAYAAADPQSRGPSLDDIWDGDGTNDNALLTIFRHFDSASVLTGFVGEIPKSMWLLDYPILERIYYDLVAGFNVFGNVVHQVSTRLYMDYLRMESEELFLSFLPTDVRKPLRESWYKGALAGLATFTENRHLHLHAGTQIAFKTDDPKKELIEMILARMSPAVRGTPDPINRCSAPPCYSEGASSAERKAEAALERLTDTHGPWVRRMPDVGFLRVHVGQGGRDDLVYTLARNKAHENVAFMFEEKLRRDESEDTMTVIPGYVGNYPNFFFDVELDEIGAFVEALRAVSDDAAFTKLVERYGVRRTAPTFWARSDWFNDQFARTEPVEAGLFDLNRYANY